jgi:hypothetical protein
MSWTPEFVLRILTANETLRRQQRVKAQHARLITEDALFVARPHEELIEKRESQDREYKSSTKAFGSTNIMFQKWPPKQESLRDPGRNFAQPQSAVLATRNPIQPAWSDEIGARRLLLRLSEGLKKPPPRVTRIVPVLGPVGSAIGCAASE